MNFIGNLVIVFDSELLLAHKEGKQFPPRDPWCTANEARTENKQRWFMADVEESASRDNISHVLLLPGEDQATMEEKKDN